MYAEDIRKEKGSFIINKNGEIAAKHVGLVPKSEYADLIKKLLKKT